MGVEVELLRPPHLLQDVLRVLLLYPPLDQGFELEFVELPDLFILDAKRRKSMNAFLDKTRIFTEERSWKSNILEHLCSVLGFVLYCVAR